MRNILVSTISFVNKQKEGSEIYATFAKRLINDVLTKTPYDIMVSTNQQDSFLEIAKENSERVFIKQEYLANHKTHVGAFNQLLKFYAIQNIDKKYDWVLYLDCDAGFTDKIDVEDLEAHIDMWEARGHDMVALRTNATYVESEERYIKSLANQSNDYNLFDAKFRFYGIKPEWRGSCFPSEHILLIKNNEKLEVMANEFEKFCTLFETQDTIYPVTYDMEAFEIGVSAFLAGYNVGEMDWGNQCQVLKVGFNYNNWENIKR
jgi:hypothetical protein